MSDDVLQPSMVFNVEPAIYLNGHGLRLCDLVAVDDDGWGCSPPFTPASRIWLPRLVVTVGTRVAQTL